MPNNRIVLTIENNALNLMSLKTVFQMEGIRMLEARDIEGGLKIIRRYKPDLILISHELAGNNIGAAVQLIKNDSAFQKTPILAFSGDKTLTNGDKILGSGISGFISKPILSSSFVDDVKRYMNGKRTEDVPVPSAEPKRETASKVEEKPGENGDRNYPIEPPPLDPYIFDWLTGLFNQGYIRKSLDLEIKRALRHGYSVSLIKLDVDSFKKHNDRFGRWLGDLVLRETGEIVRSGIREIDLAGRYEDDTFAIVLPYADKDGAIQVAQRILEKVQTHLFSPSLSILINNITVCLGIFSCPSDSKTIEDVLQGADRRLKKAKEKGTNQFNAQD